MLGQNPGFRIPVVVKSVVHHWRLAEIHFFLRVAVLLSIFFVNFLHLLHFKAQRQKP